MLVATLVLALLTPVASAGATSTASTISVAKEKSKVTPSPAPIWPPKGFKKSSDGNTFAKIPTAKELVGLASSDKVLTKALARTNDGVPVCEKFSCGAVQVVSLVGCKWWVITADVKGITSITDKTQKIFGQVRTTFSRTSSQKFATILIVSKEPIDLLHSVGNIKAECRRDVPTEKVPSTSYTITP